MKSHDEDIASTATDSAKTMLQPRPSLKTHHLFNNYGSWKHKLRESCFKRVREDRNHLLWKMRGTPSSHHVDLNSEGLSLIPAFQNIVSDELKKLKDSSSDNNIKKSTSKCDMDDTLWEYDGLHEAYQGDCEEILLEMQRIFYEDLKEEPVGKGNAWYPVLHYFAELENYVEVWEEEEDEYLARAVYEHMQLNEKQVHETIWCPICKQGELQENSHLIYCTLCDLQLKKGEEVNLELLRARLADVHAEHLDHGCILRPSFCIITRFDITALYIVCTGCNTFEIVI
ncbi:hypothetical protein F8388_005678 [Cannabis sativa]|uniref:RPA-interacting protein n=1 Tax=Cannabis sativa TaxID=3483 RepID=A0A7J6HHX2_CANSA|nr:hypothetical protein F8388_005678 [Cannabis sativa]KAF4394635.1 hypothetical protein G4B88_009885 [Cannabis sativa]